MSDLIDALVSFTDTCPEVIPNLRATHQPGDDGYCRACPSGTPHEECPFLKLVDVVEARKASPPPAPATVQPGAVPTLKRTAHPGGKP